MPPVPPAPPGKVSDGPLPPYLAPYPTGLDRQLKVTLFPLDITTNHWLRSGKFTSIISADTLADSPLTSFLNAFLTATFAKMAALHHGHAGDNIGLALHDPLCVWYLLTKSHPEYQIKLSEPQDIRVETSGQWTRGMYVVDRRDRKKMPGNNPDEPLEVVGDAGLWLDERAGNRINVAIESGGIDVFGEQLIKRILSV
jgi:hypothetical protein